MALIAELIVTILFILLSVLFTQELLNLGVIKLETFPFAPFFTVIIALTLVINKVTNYIVGLIIENKEMKDLKAMETLLDKKLDEKLKPVIDKLDKVADKSDKVIDNQNLLILELREKGVVEKTTQISTSVK